MCIRDRSPYSPVLTGLELTFMCLTRSNSSLFSTPGFVVSHAAITMKHARVPLVQPLSGMMSTGAFQFKHSCKDTNRCPFILYLLLPNGDKNDY